MKRRILLLALSLLAVTTVTAAELMASTLKGRIITSNPKQVEVFITENDGSILDLGDIDQTGQFQLDISVMDEPSYAEVNKLFLEIREKKGPKQRFAVKQYLKRFDETVELRPIVLN